jgi:3-hydroxyisobutyrate dehydrogenase-like beta-hydroxyacid dehydrogenase
MQIGFIGVEDSWEPLARKLVRAGKDVLIFDLRKRPLKRTSRGHQRQAAAKVDDLAPATSSSPASAAAAHQGRRPGENGLYAKMRKGAPAHRTVHHRPRQANELRIAAEGRGLGYCSAPGQDAGPTPRKPRSHVHRRRQGLYEATKHLQDHRHPNFVGSVEPPAP